MPIYTYKCNDCGREFEEYCSTCENHDKTCCAKCGGGAKKILSPMGYRWRYIDEVIDRRV